MKPLPTFRTNHIASFGLIVLLSACGGGGGTASPTPAMPAPPAATAPAAATPAVVAPSEPVSADAADQINGAYTLLPPSPATDSSGEAPYPDLSTLPTRIMAFEPVVYGDVSHIAVTSTP
jgi:hypothetical protein